MGQAQSGGFVQLSPGFFELSVATSGEAVAEAVGDLWAARHVSYFTLPVGETPLRLARRSEALLAEDTRHFVRRTKDKLSRGSRLVGCGHKESVT